MHTLVLFTTYRVSDRGKVYKHHPENTVQGNVRLFKGHNPIRTPPPFRVDLPLFILYSRYPRARATKRLHHVSSAGGR